MKRALFALVAGAAVCCFGDAEIRGPGSSPVLMSTNWLSMTNIMPHWGSVASRLITYYNTTQNVDRCQFEEFQSTNKPSVRFLDGVWRVRFDAKRISILEGGDNHGDEEKGQRQGRQEVLDH